MKLTKYTLPWVAWLVLLSSMIVSAIQVREPENETEPAPSTSSPAALTATEPTDNGMAVGEAPDVDPVEPTGSSISSSAQLPLEIKTEVYIPSASAPPNIDAVFPENHRNTSNPSIESPPFLESYNKYQQQYREYYNQKSQHAATARPFKFDDTPSSPGFVPSLPHFGLGSEPDIDNVNLKNHGLSGFRGGYDIENLKIRNPSLNSFSGGSESDNIKLRNKPFPYLYEGLSLPEPTQQVAYPIPEHNALDTSFSEEENKGTDPLEAPLKPAFPSFGFPFANLFGGFKKPPSHLVHSEGHRSEVNKHKGGGSWKKIIKVLTTVVPFGLLLATLTPNLLYINTTEENKPSRVRSLDNNVPTNLADPLFDIVQRLGGLEAMEDPQCEDRFFCEMSVLGKTSQSNLVEKGFWYLANETPDNLAEEVGMKELFAAIKNNKCETFICEKKLEKSGEESQHTSNNKEKKEKKFPKKYKGS